MIIEPNTPNQVRFRDDEGDQAWFDVMTDGVVITTVDVEADYHAALLDYDDVMALVKHLVDQKFLSRSDLSSI